MKSGEVVRKGNEQGKVNKEQSKKRLRYNETGDFKEGERGSEQERFEEPNCSLFLVNYSLKKSVVAQKAFAFAIRIIKLYRYLTEKRKEYIISKQIVRSGTSIGANIREASMGQSKKDFIAKMQISLKEAAETEYWLELLIATETLDKDQGSSLLADLKEILKLQQRS